MASIRTFEGKCHVCGVETDHDIVPIFTKGIGFGFGLECPLCGNIVPEQAWQHYQKSGDVIVPNMFRGNPSYQKTRPGRYI